MSLPNQQQITLTQAQTLLNQFNCIDTAPTVSEAEKILLRQALLLLASLSDYQILGICADTTAQGLLALSTYSQALGYEIKSDLPQLEGGIYIKFNGKNGKAYLDAYTGNHRGVLVSYQSAFEDAINTMYGHLPLDLFV